MVFSRRRFGGLSLRRVLPTATVGIGIAALIASPSCKSDDEKVELAKETIGPDGGTISGGGVTVEIPAGALASEVEITLSKVDDRLTVLDYTQRGSVFALSPEDQRMLLPARITLDKAGDDDSSLFKDSVRTTVFPGDTIYTDHFGRFAVSDTGTPLYDVTVPELGNAPTSPGPGHVDIMHVDASLDGTKRFDVVLTAYDYAAEYGPLNGDADGTGHCGFRLTNLVGGSKTTECGGGEVTASVNVTGSNLSFDVVPFQAPKMENPVPVAMVIGNEDIAFSFGYFEFATGPCFSEDCSGHGTCQPGSPPVCECDEGYAPDGLKCDCVPQCDGRECGGDSCGGSCPPGCGDNEECDFGAGVCMPSGGDGDGDGDGDPTTGDGDGDGDGDGATTAGDGDGDGDGDGATTTGDGDGDGDGDGATTGDGDGDGDGDAATSTT